LSVVVDFLDVGTKLTVTPHIAENGDIPMEINPEVSEGTVSSSDIPSEDKTQAETTVLVRDGQTVLFGGIIREKKIQETTRAPVLSDIPWLGDFFKKNQHRHCQKRNRGIDYPTTGDRRHLAGSRTDEKHVKTPGGLPMMALSQNVSGKDFEPEKPAFTARK